MHGTANEAFGGRASAVALVLCLALGAGLALRSRFVLDDAFISFQYARSLAEGSGLTWFGTHVEGYTNFLWVLWIAFGIRLGADPIVWAHAGSIAAFLAAIFACWRLTFAVLGSRVAGVAAVALFVTNHSVVSFATSGLETMLQTACVTGAAALVYAMWDRGQITIRLGLGFSVLAGLAILTRLDSLIPLAMLACTLAVVLPRSSWDRRTVTWLVAPALTLVTPWLVWKLAYYGRLFPNSYYAKAGGSPGLALNGIRYLARFMAWYWFWPVLVAGALAHAVHRHAVPSRLLPPIAIVAAWFSYIVWVGGDFMEFRFLVPVMPFLCLVVAHCVFHALGRVVFGRPAPVAIAIVALLIFASARHAAGFRLTTKDQTLDSVAALSSFYGLCEDGDWSRLGRSLRRELGDLDPVIALHAVGAVPYYSGLRTVDIFGLNEPEIARVGLRGPADFRRPGHQRQLPLRYLRERGVTFVLGHPLIIPRGSLAALAGTSQVLYWLANCVGFDPEPPTRATLVAIPIDQGRALVAWYLSPGTRIGQRIRERGWEAVEVRRHVKPD